LVPFSPTRHGVQNWNDPNLIIEEKIQRIPGYKEFGRESKQDLFAKVSQLAGRILPNGWASEDSEQTSDKDAMTEKIEDATPSGEDVSKTQEEIENILQEFQVRKWTLDKSMSSDLEKLFARLAQDAIEAEKRGDVKHAMERKADIEEILELMSASGKT